MKYYNIITVKKYCATNTKGARFAYFLNNYQRLGVFDYDYNYSPEGQHKRNIRSLGLDIVGAFYLESKKGYNVGYIVEKQGKKC